MEIRDLKALMEQVRDGSRSVDDAVDDMRAALSQETFSDLGYARVDNRRGLRQGVSEVVYGAGKTVDQIAGICARMRENGQERILITRLDAEKASALSERLDFEYRELPRLGLVGSLPEPDGNGTVVVACGGTSDLPVAEEAAVTAEMLGNKVTRLPDVGVAGIHRLLAAGDDIAHAQVIVAVAGMEGALASVIGGLAACPVIAVPTSVGYGASFGGVAALLAMLNSCASGVSVVNIDNGFGAGFQAHLINHVHAAR
jgi:NCAIR mutase (PurE)-related protein